MRHLLLPALLLVTACSGGEKEPMSGVSRSIYDIAKTAKETLPYLGGHSGTGEGLQDHRFKVSTQVHGELDDTRLAETVAHFQAELEPVIQSRAASWDGEWDTDPGFAEEINEWLLLIGGTTTLQPINGPETVIEHGPFDAKIRARAVYDASNGHAGAVIIYHLENVPPSETDAIGIYYTER